VSASPQTRGPATAATSATARLAYTEALDELGRRGRFGVRLGLGRIRALLRGLGDPQDGLRGALVAGTNGKGSVLALCSSALREAGYRVGETPKPHLVSYRERVQVDGRPIDEASFARLVERVLPIADRVARRLGPATEFELLTAVVFAWFAEAGIEVALVEVGLGGRLDATHAWDGGVAVVTNVGLDHMDRLGPTIEAIAREKAAIIERGDLAVTGADGSALRVVAGRARRVGAPLRIAPPAPVVALDRDGLVVDLARLGPTRVGLRGRHQAANVAVADATLDSLEAAGIAVVSAEVRRRGYAAARWPGRLELIDVARADGPVPVLLDGAHNPAGARALATALVDLRPFLGPAAVRGVAAAGPTRQPAPASLAGATEDQDVPLTLIIGIMADKDVDGMIAALAADGLRGARIVCTSPRGGRALPASALAERWRTLASDVDRVSIRPDPAEALEEAIASAPGPIVVAGSLYLVGEVRGRLLPDPSLDDRRRDEGSTVPSDGRPSSTMHGGPGPAGPRMRDDGA
jgi:dihydrofolate synthase/folylpolyglutamate synthase